MRIEAYAIIAVVVIAVLTFMVWGDDGPFWKNFLMQAWIGVIIIAVVVVGTWVSTYGN